MKTRNIMSSLSLDRSSWEEESCYGSDDVVYNDFDCEIISRSETDKASVPAPLPAVSHQLFALDTQHMLDDDLQRQQQQQQQQQQTQTQAKKKWIGYTVTTWSPDAAGSEENARSGHDWTLDKGAGGLCLQQQQTDAVFRQKQQSQHQQQQQQQLIQSSDALMLGHGQVESFDSGLSSHDFYQATNSWSPTVPGTADTSALTNNCLELPDHFGTLVSRHRLQPSAHVGYVVTTPPLAVTATATGNDNRALAESNNNIDIPASPLTASGSNEYASASHQLDFNSDHQDMLVETTLCPDLDASQLNSLIEMLARLLEQMQDDDAKQLQQLYEAFLQAVAMWDAKQGPATQPVPEVEQPHQLPVVSSTSTKLLLKPSQRQAAAAADLMQTASAVAAMQPGFKRRPSRLGRPLAAAAVQVAKQEKAAAAAAAGKKRGLVPTGTESGVPPAKRQRSSSNTDMLQQQAWCWTADMQPNSAMWAAEPEHMMQQQCVMQQQQAALHQQQYNMYQQQMCYMQQQQQLAAAYATASWPAWTGEYCYPTYTGLAHQGF